MSVVRNSSRTPWQWGLLGTMPKDYTTHRALSSHPKNSAVTAVAVQEWGHQIGQRHSKTPLCSWLERFGVPTHNWAWHRPPSANRFWKGALSTETFSLCTRNPFRLSRQLDESNSAFPRLYREEYSNGKLDRWRNLISSRHREDSMFPATGVIRITGYV